VVADKKKQDSTTKTPAFEQALARLEEIAACLESGELALEEAIALAEEGLKLSQLCERQLTEAEGKIQQLVERMGVVGLEPLRADSEEADEEA
jgi:exodeoxyribonuclease VII small subunit